MSIELFDEQTATPERLREEIRKMRIVLAELKLLGESVVRAANSVLVANGAPPISRATPQEMAAVERGVD